MRSGGKRWRQRRRDRAAAAAVLLGTSPPRRSTHRRRPRKKQVPARSPRGLLARRAGRPEPQHLRRGRSRAPTQRQYARPPRLRERGNPSASRHSASTPRPPPRLLEPPPVLKSPGMTKISRWPVPEKKTTRGRGAEGEQSAARCSEMLRELRERREKRPRARSDPMPFIMHIPFFHFSATAIS